MKSTVPPQLPQLVDPEAAAKILGLAGPQTLASWRCRRKPALSFYRSGKKIMYDVNDLLAFLQSRKVCLSEAER